MIGDEFKTVDLLGTLKDQTEKAWRVTFGRETVWVPKSTGEYLGRGRWRISARLAKDKGLI